MRIRNRTKILIEADGRIWVKKWHGSVDFHTPIHPPLQVSSHVNLVDSNKVLSRSIGIVLKTKIFCDLRFNLRSRRSIKPGASDPDRRAGAKSVTRVKSGESSLSCVSYLSRASYLRYRRASSTEPFSSTRKWRFRAPTLNEGFRKRSPEVFFFTKTPVYCFYVDGRKRRFSNTMM